MVVFGDGNGNDDIDGNVGGGNSGTYDNNDDRRIGVGR